MKSLILTTLIVLVLMPITMADDEWFLTHETENGIQGVHLVSSKHDIIMLASDGKNLFYAHGSLTVGAPSVAFATGDEKNVKAMAKKMGADNTQINMILAIDKKTHWINNPLRQLKDKKLFLNAVKQQKIVALKALQEIKEKGSISSKTQAELIKNSKENLEKHWGIERKPQEEEAEKK